MFLISFLSGVALLVFAGFAEKLDIIDEIQVLMIIVGMIVVATSLSGIAIIEEKKHNIENYGECIVKLKDEEPADRKLLCEKYKLETK